MTAESHDGTPCKPICTELLKLHIELHIRHGSALNLRNMKWSVKEQHTNEPLIERPVLEPSGLHTENILSTTAECHSDVFDVPEATDTVAYGTRVAGIYSGIFHSNPGQKRDQEDTPDTWLDLGEE